MHKAIFITSKSTKVGMAWQALDWNWISKLCHFLFDSQSLHSWIWLTFIWSH